MSADLDSLVHSITRSKSVTMSLRRAHLAPARYK